MLLNIKMDWESLGVAIAGAGLLVTILSILISKLLTDKKDVIILQQVVNFLKERVDDLEDDVKELKNKRR